MRAGRAVQDATSPERHGAGAVRASLPATPAKASPDGRRGPTAEERGQRVPRRRLLLPDRRPPAATPSARPPTHDTRRAVPRRAALELAARAAAPAGAEGRAAVPQRGGTGSSLRRGRRRRQRTARRSTTRRSRCHRHRPASARKSRPAEYRELYTASESADRRRARRGAAGRARSSRAAQVLRRAAQLLDPAPRVGSSGGAVFIEGLQQVSDFTRKPLQQVSDFTRKPLQPAPLPQHSLKRLVQATPGSTPRERAEPRGGHWHDAGPEAGGRDAGQPASGPRAKRFLGISYM
jgi:hypothetical protein